MCSYNMLNGAPTWCDHGLSVLGLSCVLQLAFVGSGNPNLTAVLREDWGFDGYITSDSDSIRSSAD